MLLVIILQNGSFTRRAGNTTNRDPTSTKSSLQEEEIKINVTFTAVYISEMF